jgi:hypothetical protein
MQVAYRRGKQLISDYNHPQHQMGMIWQQIAELTVGECSPEDWIWGEALPVAVTVTVPGSREFATKPQRYCGFNLDTELSITISGSWPKVDASRPRTLNLGTQWNAIGTRDLRTATLS